MFIGKQQDEILKEKDPLRCTMILFSYSGKMVSSSILMVTRLPTAGTSRRLPSLQIRGLLNILWSLWGMHDSTEASCIHWTAAQVKCVFLRTTLSLFPTFLHCVFFRLISLHTFIVSHMLGHIISFGKRDRATINANLCVLDSYPEGFVQLCPNSKYFKHTQFHQVVHASENFPGFS